MSTKQRKANAKRTKRIGKSRQEKRNRLYFQQTASRETLPLLACAINAEWQDDGMASILVARELGESRVTFAAFLVDIWAMGLKDAWGRTNMSLTEYRETESKFRQNVDLCSVDLGLAKHIVYGGIELSRDLGFRLPRRYERWTAILGPLPADESPDMSLFLDEGKIRLTCTQRDLEKRLIGCSIEQFLQRPDVEYIIGDDDFSLIDDDDDEAAQFLDDLEGRMLDRVKKWCFANGMKPHPLLGDLIGATLEVASQEIPEDLDTETGIPNPPEDHWDEIHDRAIDALCASSHVDPGAVEEAKVQLGAYMHHLGSAEALADTMNCDEPPDPLVRQ